MIPTLPCPSGRSGVYAVLGHPVAHSLSPAMHNPTLQAMGLDALYLAFDVLPDDLPTVLPAMARMGFRGCNLTLPHKEIAARFLDDVEEEARRAGSVNTIHFTGDGHMRGYSSDGVGLTRSLEEAFGVAFRGQAVAILGCGGAGRAAALQALSQGARALLLANRNRGRALALATDLEGRFPDIPLRVAATWPPSPEDLAELDLILQCSTSGMKAEDPPLLTPRHFQAGQHLLDMTYVLPETPTMAAARTAGIQACNGLGMLLHQGVRSLEIWTGRAVPVDIMRQALTRAAYPEPSTPEPTHV